MTEAFSIVSIIFVLAILILFFFIKKREGKDLVYGMAFLVTLIVGFVLYLIGMMHASTDHPTYLIVIRALIVSFRSFGANFGFNEVIALIRTNTVYGVAIVIHFIVSMLIAFIMIIKVFGKNAINRVSVFINSFRSKYIIFGYNQDTDIFLTSLSKAQKRRVVIILEDEDKKLKLDLMYKGYKVVFLPSKSKKKKLSNRLFHSLKIAGITRNKNRVDILTFLDDDEKNLLLAKVVTNYLEEAIGHKKNQNKKIELSEAQKEIFSKINLFSHIQYSSIDKVENYRFVEGSLGRVKFFNLHEMRARKFLIDYPLTQSIPRDFINTQKARLFNSTDNGHTNYKIGHIFVGYGKSNKQMLKKCLCANQMLNYDFNALVIDKNAKKLEQSLKCVAPGLFDESDCGLEKLKDEKEIKYFPSPTEKINIEFLDLEIESNNFYAAICKEVKKYDFVQIVVSLGSDKHSSETALQIRQALLEKNLLEGKIKSTTYSKVKLFSKISTSEIFSDSDFLCNDFCPSQEITSFGEKSEVLNEEYVIGQELDYLALIIANSYQESTNKKTPCKEVTSWDAMTEFKRGSNRYAAISIFQKLNLLGFRLVRGDTENHSIINEYKKAYNMALSSLKLEKSKDGNQFVDFVDYDDNGKILDNARNNLAMLEHLRWNVYHIANGWTKYPKNKTSFSRRQEERLKQHACITTFTGLNDLRDLQARSLIESDKSISIDEAKSKLDTVRYDYDLMDKLVENLAKSKYKIERL